MGGALASACCPASGVEGAKSLIFENGEDDEELHDVWVPVVPKVKVVQEILDAIRSAAGLQNREAIFVGGSCRYESGKDRGRYLRALTTSVAKLCGEDKFFRDNAFFVGANAHGGMSGHDEWDSIIQETFFQLANEVPMVKLTFEDGPQGMGITHEVESGNPIVVKIHLPTKEISAGAGGSSLAFRQGWKAAFTTVSLCFGGGQRARVLLGSRGPSGKWAMRIRENSLPVPASGGLHYQELTVGELRDWRPTGVGAVNWEQLKAVREGDLVGHELEATYATEVVSALKSTVKSAGTGPEHLDCCVPILPLEEDLARVLQAVRSKLHLEDRELVLVTGSNSFEDGLDYGKYLRPLTEGVAKMAGQDRYFAENVVLVGASAHGGASGEAGKAWDNIIQETFFNFACKEKGQPQMIKVLFDDIEGDNLDFSIKDGRPIEVTIYLPKGMACDCENSLAFRQGWKASVARVSISFGGGPRARMLCGSRGDYGGWAMRIKDSSLIVPAAGGMFHKDLMSGNLRDWTPKGLDEATWKELLSVKEGDIMGQVDMRAHAGKVFNALKTIVQRADDKGAQSA